MIYSIIEDLIRLAIYRLYFTGSNNMNKKTAIYGGFRFLYS